MCSASVPALSGEMRRRDPELLDGPADMCVRSARVNDAEVPQDSGDRLRCIYRVLQDFRCVLGSHPRTLETGTDIYGPSSTGANQPNAAATLGASSRSALPRCEIASLSSLDSSAV